MREIGTVVGGVLLLLALLYFLGKSFDTSVRTPAHAMELAQEQARAQAARAEADRLARELQQIKQELTRVQEANKKLRQRLAREQITVELPSK